MSNEIINSLKRIKGKIVGNITRKQGFVDCCEEYYFIRPFDTINFNNKVNRLGIVDLVLNEDYNFSEILEVSIRDPILDHSNNIFGLIGDTGTGKSELAQTISLVSKKVNKDFLGRDIQMFLSYIWEDFHATLKLSKKGDVMWKDEMPKTMGKGSLLQKWEIENILHSIRKMENTFIFVDPLDIKVDLCNLYIESAGMNFKTRTNRFMLLNKRREYFGHIYAKLHDDEQFRYWYDTQKDKFIDFIKEKGGKVEIEEDDDENEEEVYSIESFLRRNYKSRTKERDIDIYLRYEEGEGSFETLAKKYGYKSGSGVEYVYKKVKEFTSKNYNLDEFE